MKQDIPVSLKIVAWLFVISGIFAAIDILASLTNNHLNINLTVINIFAGIGLLKLRSGWRTYSLIAIWFGLIVVPVAAIY